VTVLDKRGQFVLDLEQKDFRVFDNGVEQKIDHWDVGGDSLAVTLVLETSSHLEMMAPVIRSLGSIFGETVMALNGEAAVLTYDATVDLRQNFTRDHDAVERAVADLRYGAIGVNVWHALAFVMGTTSWGAYPGHLPTDIQSGSGVVANALMFDRPQKSVVRGPFRSRPKPPWSFTTRRCWPT